MFPSAADDFVDLFCFHVLRSLIIQWIRFIRSFYQKRALQVHLSTSLVVGGINGINYTIYFDYTFRVALMCTVERKGSTHLKQRITLVFFLLFKGKKDYEVCLEVEGFKETLCSEYVAL